MIDARTMVAIKTLSNAAAIKVLAALKAGIVDMTELAAACGISVTYTRLVLGKLIASGFITAPRATDLANVKVVVAERMAELACAIECVDANGEPIDATPPSRGAKGDIAANILSCVPCCRSIAAIAKMAGTDYLTAWAVVGDGFKSGVLAKPESMAVSEALAAGLVEFSADRAIAQAAEVVA